MRKLIVYIVSAAALLGCGSEAPNHISAEDLSEVDSALTTTAGATEDTYVRDGDYASTPFGQDIDIEIKTKGSNYNRTGFLKFNLPSGTVTSAKLRVYGWASSPLLLGVYGAESTSWTEDAVTWSNKPGLGSEVGSFTADAASWHEVDVTSYVAAQRAAGASSVALGIQSKASSSVLAKLRSAESTMPPELIVVSANAASSVVAAPTPAAVAACEPTSCAAQGATCGAIADGCGGTLQCGTCSAPAAPATAASTSSLWVNATDPYYWLGGGGLFADLMKQSDEWRPSSGTVEQDSNGWITQLASGQTATTYLVTDSSNYPTGTYTLTWEGKGTFSVAGAASFTINANGPGQRTFDVTSSSPLIAITVSAVDSADYLKNIRVLLPGRGSDYTSNPWNQSFLDMMKGFGGIRFMDFHSTNYKTWQDPAELTEFTSRTPSTHRTMARGHQHGGAAYEFSVDLVNRLGVNGWWCIPHNANDDFVTRFGQLLRDGLNRDRKIYIELSNEIWNFGTFDQGDRMMEKGVALGLAPDTFQATLYYQSRRTKEIVSLLKSVFGADYGSRVRVVMASQAGQQWVHENLLGYNDAYQSVDALATAPYFGHDLSDSAVVNMNLDQAFARLNESLNETITGMGRDASSAQTFSVDYVAYEGGQHLAGNGDLQNNETLTNLFVTMNRDARMGQLYTTYYDAWKRNGGTIHNVFTNVGAPTKYGSWGITEYVGQPRSAAPKYDAAMKWIGANPIWYSP